MSDCPCPRCLTPKDLFDQSGTKLDHNRRARLARVNTLQYRVKVSNARDIIYRQNRPVNSKFVNTILKDESLVATEACLFAQSNALVQADLVSNSYHRMHFLLGCLLLDSIFFLFF